MKSLVLASAFVALAGLPALADICELNSKPVTDVAMRHLSVGTVILIHRRCDGCTVKKDTVTKIDQRTSKSGVEILVNGAILDLADTYVLAQKGAKTWSNLGLLAKCDMQPSDGYTTLPANLVVN